MSKGIVNLREFKGACPLVAAKNLAGEISFGVKAVVDGVSDDYQRGGISRVLIGATGGRTQQGFFEQIGSNYSKTSIVLGPLENIDKTLVSVGSGGAITKTYGGYSFGQLLTKGPAPHLGSYTATARLAVATTAINSVIVTTSYEGGNFIGSVIRAGINRSARFYEDRFE